MAKYYIQSGNVSYIVCACDTEGAALWAMHRIMDEMICEFEAAQSEWHELMADEELSAEGVSDNELNEDELIRLTLEDHQQMEVPQAIPYDAMLEGLARFEETITVSEQGFGRNEAGELRTEDIFHQWRQLMLAVDRLHDELG